MTASIVLWSNLVQVAVVPASYVVTCILGVLKVSKSTLQSVDCVRIVHMSITYIVRHH